MRMVTGLKTLALSLKNILISVLFCFILLNVSHAATLKVDTITPKGSASDLTFTRSATGDFVFTNMGSGFLKVTNDVLTSSASFDLAADVTGTLPIANGGTNSSTALSNNYVMISSGGAIVESAVTTTTLGYLDATSSIQTQLNAKVDEVSSTDNAVVKFDGTGGSVQNTTLILDDTNNLSGLSTLTFDQVATPSNPSAGDNKLYFKSDDKLYKLDSSGNEVEVGSGGQGGINYITNFDIETNADGYTTFDDASAYVDGTGGVSSNLTLSRNTTTPLRETGDLQITQAAADSRYEGVSYDFTIDRGQQGQMITCSFWADTSDPNYVDDDIIIIAYDKDNSQIIRVNGEDLKANANPQRHYFQFQAASDADDYRVSWMVNQSNTNGYTIYFDQIACSPTRLARGAIVTGIKDFTPSIGNLSHTIQKAWYWRSGQFMNVHIEMTTDAAASGTITIGTTLDGNSVDTSQIALRQRLGSGRYLGTLTSYNISVMYDNAIVLKPNQEGALSNTIPVAESGVDSGERITVNFTVPIQGWEAEGTLAEDLGGGDVVVRGRDNAGSVSITANTTPIPFTEIEDTASAWDGSTFTAPSTGYYTVNGAATFTAAAVQYMNSYVQPVGGSYAVRNNVASQSTAIRYITFTDKVFLYKGENYQIRSEQAATTQTGAQYHWIHIQKLASGSQKFETATVAARYSTNAGQSVANNTVTTVVFEDSEGLDTHGKMNTSTGEYTINTSGVFSIGGSVLFANLSWDASERSELFLYVNGSLVEALDRKVFEATNTTSILVRGVTPAIPLDKDDVVTVRAFQNSGASATLDTTSAYNIFSIARIK